MKEHRSNSISHIMLFARGLPCGAVTLDGLETRNDEASFSFFGLWSSSTTFSCILVVGALT